MFSSLTGFATDIYANSGASIQTAVNSGGFNVENNKVHHIASIGIDAFDWAFTRKLELTIRQETVLLKR